MLRTGSYTVETILTDRFRLDGGAMFGAVPKALWERAIPSDEKNRIQLACRLLLIRGKDRVILVDVGMGKKWNEKERSIYHIESVISETLWDSLRSEVTDVILTHLHFDHAGGISLLNDTGQLELAFPNARHYVSRKNLEHAKSPGARERASYLESSFAPLSKAKLMETEPRDEIHPGFFLFQSHGHTPGLQYLVFRDAEHTLAFPSDLIPTSHHIPIPYVMGYDLCAQTSMEEKERFLAQAASENWIVVFEHDPTVPAMTFARGDDGRYRGTIFDQLVDRTS